MLNSTDRWATGENFFGRESELSTLEDLVKGRNHVLVTGQRRMGKTSVIQELGLRLQAQGWPFFFTDVQGAGSEQELVSGIAQTVDQNSVFWPRLNWQPIRRPPDSIEVIGAKQFRVKLQEPVTAGNWRRCGEEIIHSCAALGEPTLLVLDELPIFLMRLLSLQGSVERVELFLSWLCQVFMGINPGSLVVIISDSIEHCPQTERINLSSRFNFLHPFRLGPWGLENIARCTHRIAESYHLKVDDGVPEAVYQTLAIGIPQQVQSFLVQLCEQAYRKGNRNRLTVADVNSV